MQFIQLAKLGTYYATRATMSKDMDLLVGKTSAQKLVYVWFSHRLTEKRGAGFIDAQPQPANNADSIAQ
eukprot:scaffold85167_cov17-Prasinocladus_malaysianus.AAC.1